ncbi:sugar phosphate nucleotidyltransferase [Selenomonas ruminantium]|uniref:sugar phosphate nucleotidyltransferase n=1 Tax=Selenomonas ruminantium TaxID=971 RepID=UPI0026EC56B0|nr:sugar phosphate nucleotidyltransferase [Selenomonas ruminantium]
MNIILLSGGSGKRLWPLSNDIRSKQFIKLFKDDEGHYESMVQRVYRQIKTVDSEASITIATSKSQVSAINNQLQVGSSDVSISIEPKRRDTFPAILLSVAYMVDVLHHDPEEPVVICPVDPYVENSYYETVKSLDKYVREGNAAITLMGIEPTYPSEKYGYIIPEGKEQVAKVSAFKEKPDEDTAKQYLAQGALWNAGVFAFKLGYLLDKAKTLLPNEGYEDLLARYDSLPKISFDYAVLEKEPSIQVVRYRGDWKDVGTWNMIAEVMADRTKGKVTMDEDCENTNVVNELDMPVLVMGAKDMIVAVSNDGVLVADKIRSAKMKPLVEKIAGAVHYAEKSWGTYRVIDEDMDEEQGGSLTVRIDLKAGSRMTYHSHAFRDETWNVLSGTGKALLDGEEYDLEPGSSLSIAAGQKHTLRADTDMSVVEVQVGDVIRKKDKRIYELPDEQ